MLTTTACEDDVTTTLLNFLTNKGLKWTKLVGTCTGEALLLTDIQSGFKAHIKPARHPSCHYVLHRYALALKTRPLNLAVFCAVVKIVTHIQSSSTYSAMYKVFCGKEHSGHLYFTNYYVQYSEIEFCN